MSMRDLLESRARTVQDLKTITENPEADGDLSDAQSKRFDELKGELGKLEARIQRQATVDEAERRMAAPAIISGNGRDGSFEDRARGFSLIKAICASLGDPVDAGFEREISAEVRSRSGRQFVGIPVPDQYLSIERRVLTVDPHSSPQGPAAPLYPVVHRPDMFVDLLRSSLVTGRLGATMLGGLQGDQSIPRQTASSTAEWLAEDAAITPSDASFDDVTLAPRTVASMTSFSRRTMINASPDIENLLRRDLASVLAQEVDYQAVFGDGQANRPLGVVNQPNVTELTLATPSWSQVLAFISTVQGADADVGNLGWLMTPGAVAKLRSTNKVSGEAEHGFLMPEPGALAGYPAVVSTMVPSAGSPVQSVVAFGAWSQMLIGSWSGIDILANPYSDAAYARGRIMLRAMKDVDVAIRHPESFAYADDLAVG